MSQIPWLPLKAAAQTESLELVQEFVKEMQEAVRPMQSSDWAGWARTWRRPESLTNQPLESPSV